VPLHWCGAALAAELGLEPRLGDPESQPDRTKGHRGFAKFFGPSRQFCPDSPFVPVPLSRGHEDDVDENRTRTPQGMIMATPHFAERVGQPEPVGERGSLAMQCAHDQGLMSDLVG
jgi:hypothetical protein